MFGLTVKEKMRRLILNVSQQECANLALEIVRLARLPIRNSSMAAQAVAHYQNRVVNGVSAVLAQRDPSAHPRFQSLFVDPSPCGLSRDYSDGPVSAGALYAIACFALTGKKVRLTECLAVSRAQQKLINQTAVWVAKESAKR